MRRAVKLPGLPSLASLSLLAACAPEAPAPTAPPSPAPPPPASLVPATAPSAPGAVGAACKFERPFAQSDCTGGLMCAPAPGGYCTAFCGVFGPCAGVCAEAPRGGELCYKSCERDADCRTGEGYV